MNSLLRRGRGHRSPQGREAMAFGAVGVISTLVDLILFNGFHVLLTVGSMYAKIMSTAIATVVSYGGNRHWSFRHRSGLPVRHELPRFVGLTAVGLGITLACLGVARYILHQRGLLILNVAANGLGLGLAMVWRFWSYRRWVFNRDQLSPRVTV